MTILFLILVSLAVLHYMYEAILLPTIQLQIRYRLFAIRDEIRTLMQNNKAEKDRNALNELHASINGAIRWLPLLDFGMYFHAMHIYKGDAAFREMIDKRNAILESCSIQEAKKLRGDIATMLNYSLLANCGAWCIYIVPVGIMYLSFHNMIDNITDSYILFPVTATETKKRACEERRR